MPEKTDTKVSMLVACLGGLGVCEALEAVIEDEPAIGRFVPGLAHTKALILAAIEQAESEGVHA